MANIYQQRTRQRKIAYTVAILVLFTVSLLLRRNLIEPSADSLQLREKTRGEVELTSSAVRLMMTGSRGWVTTVLWANAIEKQKKHEWNELELLVGSITKLQPYFLTPWLFQSWNLAFNVAVECDRPKDKYYYITRGIDLLAEGERRNQGRDDNPGHPELRQTMGVYYLRKIGTSDEKTTMRCLYDLSCIDPLLRNPAWFKSPDPKDGREVVDAKELARFCQSQPRLVRRLREGLELPLPRVIDFLDKNRDVPSRFEAPDWASLAKQMPDQRQSKLKSVREQFPVLPPPSSPGSPNPEEYDLTPESNDVFLAARSWMEYSHQPLPPPMFGDDAVKDLVKKERKFRLPKMMALIIFRGYVGRCQEYIAENLQEEGWFDEDGWVIRDWFEKEGGEGEFRVGTESKYHAQPAWERAHNLYYEYGRGNDLLLFPQDVEDLNAKAEPYRQAHKVKPGAKGDLGADERERLGPSWLAHHRLIWNSQNLGMTNFEVHYYATMAERAKDAVTGRKLFHQAERLQRGKGWPADADDPHAGLDDQERSLKKYEQAWPFWMNVLLQNPKFAQQSLTQEDSYEWQVKHIRLTQRQRSKLLESLALFAARMSVWPHPPLEHLLSPQDKLRILPIRNFRGPLDWVQIANLPDHDLAKTRFFVSVWPMATAGFPGLLQPPVVYNQSLTRSVSRDAPVPVGWRHLIDDASIQSIRDRVGVNKRD